MAQHEERPTGFFFRNQTLNLRQDIGFPGRDVCGFLTVLIFDIGNPYAIEIRWRGARVTRKAHKRHQNTKCRGVFHKGIHACQPIFPV